MVVLAQVNLNTLDQVPAPSARSTPTRPPQRRLRRADEAKICELYQQGMSSRRVAEEMGVAKSTVLRVLKAAKVEMRPWGVRYD